MLIVFLSNQLFDFPLKTNKWHVATRVAELGHEVLFVDPPIRFRKLVKQIFQGRWSLRRIFTLTCQPQENLTVYTPVDLTPWRKLNARFQVKRIRRMGRMGRIENSPPRGVLWVYHVEMEDLEEYVEAIPHDLLIYDCVDNYPAFPRYRHDPEDWRWIVAREDWLARKADLAFATAPALYEKLKEKNPQTFYVGNAGDYDRFAEKRDSRLRDYETTKVQDSDPEIASLVTPHSSLATSDQRSVVGFSGTLDEYKVNLSLLFRCAKDHPDYDFVIIGPKGVADDQPDLQKLRKLANVKLLGVKPYEELPRYFSEFDAYIIPYNLNDYTLGGCFPVKFFDALAAGLPTIVTDLPAYREFGDVCYIAKGDEDFSKAIQIALLEDSEEKREARRRVARENSWDRKVEKMLKLVSARSAERREV